MHKETLHLIALIPVLLSPQLCLCVSSYCWKFLSWHVILGFSIASSYIPLVFLFLPTLPCLPLFPLPGCLFLIGVLGHIVQANLELAALPPLSEHCDLLRLTGVHHDTQDACSDLLELVSKSCMRSKYSTMYMCMYVYMWAHPHTHPLLCLKFVSFTSPLF